MDIVVALTGPKGVGKSTLAIQLARKIATIRNIEFDLGRHVAYTFNQIINAIEELNEFEPLVIDEAVNVMMAEDWNTFQSKYLKKLFAKLRVKHLAIFICIPNFSWLDRKYREDMVNVWIRVWARGLASVFLPNTFEAEDKWNLEWFKKRKIYTNYFSSVEKIANIVKQHPNFFDFIKFEKLPNELEAQYRLIRAEAVRNEESQSEKEDTSKVADKILLINHLLERKIPEQEIMKVVGIKPTTFLNYKKKIQKAIKFADAIEKEIYYKQLKNS
jgi:predicted kinase